MLLPSFREEIIEEGESTRVIRSTWGVTMRVSKGAVSMPQYINYPVSTLGDFEAIKHRLDSRQPDRYPDDWVEKVDRYKTSN
jgi:uroporphyrinogen decarboxylase